MTERVCCFGPGEALVGVLTEPEADRDRTDAPVLLWLNSGLLHSVGPFGWYVTLARRFADQGITSFRFDISGVGDSPPRADGRGRMDTGIADATAAMDFLGRDRGARRFVLIGLCSGAVLAQQLASREERVAGAVLIDGWGYRTAGFYLRHYARRVFHWRPWAQSFKRLFRTHGEGAENEASSLEDKRLIVREYYFDYPSPQSGRAQIVRALRRGARVLWVYTGDVEQYVNGSRQFREMLGRIAAADGIDCAYMPAADHLFSGRTARLALFSRIENWFVLTGSSSLPEQYRAQAPRTAGPHG